MNPGMTSQSFSAATYNILANAYVRPGRYPGSPPEALAPAPRRALLLDRIAALDVDLLCLQEVEPDAHEAIAARLGEGFLGVYGRRNGRPDGASLFVRRSRLVLSGHEVVHYQAHQKDDDQIALIGDVRLGTRRWMVASTHLQWCKEETPALEHLGRAQMIELLDRRSQGKGDVTWILAGDMNATSQSPVIAAAIERGMALGAAKQRPWDTCNANGRPRKLDYLLYSRGHLEPRPRALPPLRRDTPMPSLVEPSDHLPLQIDFQFAA
jgi:endonuclease/exonuclease/phosphatase family metal-dependent hydrolase